MTHTEAAGVYVVFVAICLSIRGIIAIVEEWETEEQAILLVSLGAPAVVVSVLWFIS